MNVLVPGTPIEFAESRVWYAPAKINRFLHITGRRADGYHLLQTLFQFIDLRDELRFVLRDDGVICRVGGPEGLPADDLCVRAATRLQAACGVTRGADIHLTKRIPMGGGLGGGSSDAATVLVALNELWGCGLDESELCAQGLELGADVPVFVFGRAAWAEGVGEALAEVAPDEPWMVLIDPHCHVDTGLVFSAPELTRDCQSITMAGFLAGLVSNVCEAVVRDQYPAVDEALNWLETHGGEARMTGTGACVFAACSNRDAAEALCRQVPEEWSGYVVKASNRSSLFEGS
ncbi:MAG: 4-(cytidine 5'-diphospho)-2-C-methyl-D-erythritol kinase [Gammaproteobacteria bacterium]|nr:4-(cytidine 5'-diphospho)-2-C-methyl-D-erythritol kinase [Gammaproteobacteria bacterium]